MTNNNELLVTERLPDFTKIKPEDFEPALNNRISAVHAAVEEALAQDKPVWSNSVLLIEISLARFGETLSIMSQLNNVCNDTYNAAYEKILPVVSKFNSEFIHNKKIYDLYKKVSQSDEFETKLTKAQKKGIEDSIRDFELNGVNLSDDKKKQLTELSQELSQLTNKFSNNVLSDSKAWSYHLDDKDASKIANVPQNIKDLAQHHAKEKGHAGFLFILNDPTVSAILKYADDSSLREIFYKAHSTRASENWVLPKKHNNTPLISEILAKRALMAEILGMKNYAEYSIQRKMAFSTDEVMDFLNNLNRLSRPKAQVEIKELENFAKTKYNVDKLNLWDISYYANLLEKEQINLDDEELREYFELERVINGLFFVANQLFGIKISQASKNEFKAWNDDVRLYNVYSEDGNLKGQFYADFYTRQDKNQGAWIDGYREMIDNSADKKNSFKQIPVGFLVTNFSKPVEGKPSLLLYQDVVTLFHEFGHMMHHLLTKISDNPSVAGISGVEWDAVELPSQLMENWVLQKEVIAKIAQHFKTNAPLPDVLFKKMQEKDKFQRGLWLNRQLNFAFYDFRVHLENTVEKPVDQQKIMEEVRAQVGVIPVPDWVKGQNTFTHIFSGGYAAGYYSYLWAEVLSADVFGAFEETGVFNHDTGRLFLHTILEKGSSEKMKDMFVAFRGRSPEITYLLKSYGLL